MPTPSVRWILPHVGWEYEVQDQSSVWMRFRVTATDMKGVRILFGNGNMSAWEWRHWRNIARNGTLRSAR